MKKAIVSIKYPLAIDLGLGTVALEVDYEQQVVQLIKQVLLTAPGERVNRPDFGCGLRQMIFAPNSEVTASLLQTTVYQALETWLSSAISVQEVIVKAIEERLEVTIVYMLKARMQNRQLTLDISL